MPSRIKHGLLISITVIGLFFTLVITSHSETINYIYDELNRLIRVEYESGTVIEYTYDKAGNRQQKTIIDTVPPTGTITINSGAAFTSNTNVTLILSCMDPYGCSQIQLSNDNITYSGPEPYTTTKTWILTTGDGTKTVYAKFKDTPGNWSTVYSDTILLDATAPTATPSHSGGTYNSNQSVTLSCDDGVGSGCDKIFYTTDGTTPTTSSPVYSSPINISVTTTLKFFARDVAGNSDAVKSETYTIVTGTTAVTVKLKDSSGNPLSGGVVQYYSGGWQAFGTTDASGQVSKELLPGSYSFSMTYGFSRQQKSQNIATNPTVVFQTTKVTVQLKDSVGTLMDTGTVQYYSGAWRDIGSTSGGQVSKELLPGSYTFSMNYGFARQQKSQNIATNPTVVFQTNKVTVQLKDSIGTLMDTGTVQYYSGAWRDIGSTSGGQVNRELLPGSYTFSMNYGFARQQKSQNITADPTVIFQTGRVHSESGSCTHYYAGGWRGFFQDMELLPLTYTFRFKDGTPNRSYTITTATVNPIY